LKALHVYCDAHGHFPIKYRSRPEMRMALVVKLFCRVVVSVFATALIASLLKGGGASAHN
ncbi:MAG TPA: hypothetical protein PLI90_05055, partial [Rhodocyclaceae bacterium]|nr:hypothetical protein [Rhodocyclaceae bacterium]